MDKPEIGITLVSSFLLSAWMFSFCCMEGVVLEQDGQDAWMNMEENVIGIWIKISLVLLI